MEERTVVEIRTGEAPTEEVINLGEFMEQHNKRYQLPLLNSGCIIVKKLGYLKRAEINEQYEALCKIGNVDPEHLKRLSSDYQKLLDILVKDPNNEMVNKKVKVMSEEIMGYRNLVGNKTVDLLVKQITAIILEPADLQRTIPCKKWLEEMGEEEYHHLLKSVGEFISGEKKKSPTKS